MTSRGVRVGHDFGFDEAVARLADADVRPEVELDEIPAPQRVAPHAVALSAQVTPGEVDPALDLDEDEPVVTGRFVVLHDPSGPEAWNGTWRVVTFARARLEPELASDPLLGAVGWSWLTDALDEAGVAHAALGGTVTRVVSEGFEAMAEQGSSVDLEVRASWTPSGADLPDQLRAWVDLLCTLAGLPPLPDGVRPLPNRAARGLR